MKTKWRWAETWGRRARWLAPVALFALVPKCGLCLLAYVGLGAALGLGGREMCGAATATPGAWAPSLAVAGLALGSLGLGVHRRRRDLKPGKDAGKLSEAPAGAK